MTSIQNLMLSVCFGFSVGTLVGELIFIVKYAIESRREKKGKKSEKVQ